MQETEDIQTRKRVKEFIRSRLADRYNPKWNGLFDAWAGVLTGNQDETELRAFGIADGLNAVFTLVKTTAFVRPEDSHGNAA